MHDLIRQAMTMFSRLRQLVRPTDRRLGPSKQLHLCMQLRPHESSKNRLLRSTAQPTVVRFAAHFVAWLTIEQVFRPLGWFA